MKKLLVSLMSILQLLSFAVVPCVAVPPLPGGTPSNAPTIYVYEASSESDTDNKNEDEDSVHREKPFTWYTKLKLLAALGDSEVKQKLDTMKAKNKKYKESLKAKAAFSNHEAIQKLA